MYSNKEKRIFLNGYEWRGDVGPSKNGQEPPNLEKP
jgi:hypothetical protein